jgi:DNA-binding winged helix-turn-helix (wHTH) protein
MRHRLGDLTIDLAARQLRRGDDDVHLSPKAFELLALLLAERPRAVRKQELYDRLWPDTFVVEANLTVLIAEVRAALGDREHTVIRTVHRFGYAFAGEVRDEAFVSGASAHLLVHGDERFALSEGENVAGRDPGVAIFLPSASVSRRHATITIHGDTATLADLGSKNGTWVNGERVTTPTVIADGAYVRFGGIEMTYRRLDPAGRTDTL